MSYSGFKAVDITDRVESNIAVGEWDLRTLFVENGIFNEPYADNYGAAEDQSFTNTEYDFTAQLRADNIFVTDDYNWGLTVPINVVDSSSNYSHYFIIPKVQTKGLYDSTAINMTATVAPGSNIGGVSTIVIPITYNGVTYNVNYSSAVYNYFDGRVGITDQGIQFTTTDDRFRNNKLTLRPIRLRNGYIAVLVLLEWQVGTFSNSSTPTDSYEFAFTFNRPIAIYALKFTLCLTRPDGVRKDMAMIVNKPIYKVILFIISGGDEVLIGQGLVDFMRRFIKLNENSNYLDDIATKSCYLGPIVKVCFKVAGGYTISGLPIVACASALDNGVYPPQSEYRWFTDTATARSLEGVTTTSASDFMLNSSYLDAFIAQYPEQYQIDIIEIVKTSEEIPSTPFWWVNMKAFKDDRLTIRRFNENFVEHFADGQCLYDANLYKKAMTSGLGLPGGDQDLSAVVHNSVICDKVKGSQIYATGFSAAGIKTRWDTLRIEYGIGALDVTIHSSDLGETTLLVYNLSGIGQLYIDVINWSLWVKATKTAYETLCDANYATSLNGAYGDDFNQAINSSVTVDISLNFTYDGNDVSYYYYFHLIGRDNPNLQNRKPEYYNNYGMDTQGTHFGQVG